MSRDNLYEKFIECNWWIDVDKRRANSWIQNFGQDKDIGKLILDNIFFYNNEQLNSYTKNIINQIKGEIFQKHQLKNCKLFKDDPYYFDQWNIYKQNLKVIPATIPSDASGSAYQVMPRYRSILGSDVVSDIYSIEEAIDNQIKELIFVDDFSGSGNQLKKFIEKEINVHGKLIKICDLPNEFTDLTVTIAVYVIHIKALKLLNDKFPKIKIRYIDLIDEKFDLLNDKCIFYNKLTEEKRAHIIEFIINTRENIISKDEKYKKLMQYQLNIPIVFSHGCPNNALMLLYAKTNNWRQIFKLGDDEI